MRTIQDIEQMDLTKVDRKIVSQVKRDLHDSFYHTRLSERTSDGRVLKDVIGEQLTRFTDFFMNECT